MLSNKSFFKAILSSLFNTPAFDRGTHLDVFFSHFAESNVAHVIVSTAKLSGAGDTDSSALLRTFHSRELPWEVCDDFQGCI